MSRMSYRVSLWMRCVELRQCRAKERIGRLAKILSHAAQVGSKDGPDAVEEMMATATGPRTPQTLAMVAEIIHGTPVRFSDPARYSFALGGKDGHPFPVPLKTYDESIDVLRRSLDAAKVDGGEKLEGFRRLNKFVEGVETDLRPEVELRSLVAHELALSPSLEGRSVSQAQKRPLHRSRPNQMSLF
jgi:uncharacterized protein